jgi:CHC2-type zinc finger protein
MRNQNLTTDEMEFEEFFFDLEKSWRDSLPHLSDIQWLEVFPEARGVLADKVREWGEEKERLIKIAKRALRENKAGTPIQQIETELTIKVLVMPKINEAEKHIARLKRQQAYCSPRPSTGRITDADIQRAREVPIISLISITGRRTGKTLTIKCPLHKDRSPSFVIYTESNTCWCFGCQQGGDSIALTRLLHNLSFIEAMKYLQRL